MFDKRALSIIDAVKVPVIVTDSSGFVKAANKSSVIFFGRTDIKNLNISELIPSMDFKNHPEIFLLKNGDTSYFFEIDAITNGKMKEVDLDIVFNEYEGDREYICTVKDISIYSGLLNSINKFTIMVECSPASVLITDLDGKIEFINSNFQELTGYSYEELIGKNISMLRSPFREKEFRKTVRQVLKEGDKWKGEFLNVSKSGDSYWVLATVAPILNKNNEITNYISIQEDITYLKKIEEELLQSEEKFRVLFETLPEGIVVTDLSGVIIQVNPAYLNIHGYSWKREIVGRNIFDISDDEVKPLLKSLFAGAESSGYSGAASYELKNNVKVFVEIQAALMNGEKGPIGFVVLAADSTTRRNAENALRESEARNRALVEAVPDIMFRVNNNGVYLDKMLGTKIHEVFPESVASDIVRYISDAIKSREIQIYEYPVVTSGRDEFYESRIIAIEDDEVLIILRNVTEKHIAMTQIEEARREAEFANRSKSEFLANMSHEIRTPLNSITGFIELLMRSRLDDDQREYLDIIKKSASNLLGIINDILDFSKIESHRLEIDKIPFNPFTEFESVVQLFNIKALEKGMRFFSFIDPRIPESIISDPLRIKQVLSNLLSNAIKFTPEDGYVVVEINLSRNKDGFCLVNFSVSDTGIGIPERKQKQIFEAFRQGDSSITRRFGGTGLGLSISSSLVHLLGSEIVLDSVMGIGSKFYFTLEAEVDSERTPAESIRSSGIIAAVVADSADDLAFKYLERYLSACGCEIKIFEGIRAVESVKYDALFVVKTLNSQTEFSQAEIAAFPKPVILVSDMEINPEVAAMFDHVLNHPLTPDSIFTILHGSESATQSAEAAAGVNQCGENLKFSGKILVGEDNVINQKLMMLLLKDYGLDVDLAGNGLAVYEKFQKGRYDLILMDINMPVADGIETTHMIREYEKENNTDSVPIVALTAKALKGDREIIFESGMDDYLAKPLEMENLESILLKYLYPAAYRVASAGGSFESSCVDSPEYYDLKKTASELRIPVNVLLNIGRDYFEDTPGVLEDIRNAAEASMYTQVSGFAHKIRGASANLRFVKIADYFLLLEEKAANGEKDFDYNAILDNIKNELDRLKGFF